MMPTLIFLQYDKQMQMAVMNLTNKHSQFPQTAEWTQWLCDAYWPSLDVWAIICGKMCHCLNHIVVDLQQWYSTFRLHEAIDLLK